MAGCAVINDGANPLSVNDHRSNRVAQVDVEGFWPFKDTIVGDRNRDHLCRYTRCKVERPCRDAVVRTDCAAVLSGVINGRTLGEVPRSGHREGRCPLPLRLSLGR